MKTAIKASLFGVLLTFGVAIGFWSLIAFTAGLKQADWQLTELLRQYLIATGVVKPSTHPGRFLPPYQRRLIPDLRRLLCGFSAVLQICE